MVAETASARKPPAVQLAVVQREERQEGRQLDRADGREPISDAPKPIQPGVLAAPRPIVGRRRPWLRCATPGRRPAALWPAGNAASGVVSPTARTLTAPSNVPIVSSSPVASAKTPAGSSLGSTTPLPPGNHLGAGIELDLPRENASVGAERSRHLRSGGARRGARRSSRILRRSASPIAPCATASVALSLASAAR